MIGVYIGDINCADKIDFQSKQKKQNNRSINMKNKTPNQTVCKINRYKFKHKIHTKLHAGSI